MEKKIDGTLVSEVLYTELLKYIEKKSHSASHIESLPPKLRIISVGDNYGSKMYGNMKKKKLSEKLGYDVETIHYDDISYDSLRIDIENANTDGLIDGVMLQLPLSQELSKYERELLDLIDSKKDVDGLTSNSLGDLVVGKNCLESCTPKGIITLLKVYNVPLIGKNVCIVNRSNIVGKPLFHMFLRENATPTICHSKTNNLKEMTRQADILITATNQCEMFDRSYIKDNAVIIDVGVNKNSEDQTVGDVDYSDVYDKASLITPPIGGVGPMTVCMLAYNTAKAKYGNEVDVVLNDGIEKAKQLIK